MTTRLEKWANEYTDDPANMPFMGQGRGFHSAVGGFRHAIEVLCIMGPKDYDGTVNDAIAILKDYADKEANETN